jgi:hypothetical protein
MNANKGAKKCVGNGGPEPTASSHDRGQTEECDKKEPCGCYHLHAKVVARIS